MKDVRFKVGACTIWLHSVEAHEHMSITKLRKLLQWASKSADNDEPIREFFSCIPETAEYLRFNWDEDSKKFRKEYLDEKYDSTGHVIADPNARKWRRSHNKRLMNEVKASKARYEKFTEKKIPKLKELEDEFINGR